MRLRYFIGAFAALLFTACSVEVDLEEASQLEVSATTEAPYSKVMLSNGRKGYGIHLGKNDVINSSYDLFYVGSDKPIFKMEDYEDGYAKARIMYKAFTYNAEDLAPIYFGHETVTVPGTSQVTVNASPITKEYVLRMPDYITANITDWNGTLRGLPSQFNPLTGKAQGNQLSVKFTLQGGTAKVCLPVMETIPDGVVAYMQHDKKNHKVVLESGNTIKIIY